jgi:hypothetical protein
MRTHILLQNQPRVEHKIRNLKKPQKKKIKHIYHLTAYYNVQINLRRK